MGDLPCASIASRLHEPLHATASRVHSWVLLEQPGPWGPDALTESRLPVEIGLALKARARREGFRALLLRRPSGTRTSGYQSFLAHSGRGGHWVEQRILDDPAELLDVDLSPLAHGRRVGFGDLRKEPLYLVCTNGRHDPCCARLGRPLVRALLETVGGAVWECSHVGGDRFAANLVCLPDGLYFGRVGPADGPRVVEGHRRGIIDLDHYRGRAGDAFAVQAAEHFLRRMEGLDGVDDVVPEGCRELGRGVVEVRLAGPDGRRFAAVVGIEASEERRPLTCAGASSGQHPATYAPISVRELEPGGGDSPASG